MAADNRHFRAWSLVAAASPLAAAARIGPLGGKVPMFGARPAGSLTKLREAAAHLGRA